MPRSTPVGHGPRHAWPSGGARRRADVERRRHRAAACPTVDDTPVGRWLIEPGDRQADRLQLRAPTRPCSPSASAVRRPNPAPAAATSATSARRSGSSASARRPAGRLPPDRRSRSCSDPRSASTTCSTCRLVEMLLGSSSGSRWSCPSSPARPRPSPVAAVRLDRRLHVQGTRRRRAPGRGAGRAGPRPAARPARRRGAARPHRRRVLADPRLDQRLVDGRRPRDIGPTKGPRPPAALGP